jgi:hypothetical protein
MRSWHFPVDAADGPVCRGAWAKSFVGRFSDVRVLSSGAIYGTVYQLSLRQVTEEPVDLTAWDGGETFVRTVRRPHRASLYLSCL